MEGKFYLKAMTSLNSFPTDSWLKFNIFATFFGSGILSHYTEYYYVTSWGKQLSLASLAYSSDLLKVYVRAPR